MSEEKTGDELKEEIREAVAAGEKEETQESTETQELSVEEQATALGWHKDGKNIHGETVDAGRFLQEKPLYDTLEKHKKTFKKLDTQVLQLQEDNKKIAKASITEKENLLKQLADAKDLALTNMEQDEVRKIDKQMDDVREEIAAAPTETQSPYYGAFLEENSWDNDPDDPRTMAAVTIAGRFMQLNPQAGDKAMYDHVHTVIREKFPEKFETKKPAQKVASTNKRVTESTNKKKAVTLADLDPEEAAIVRVMIDSTGMSEEDYMKNYSTEALR